MNRTILIADDEQDIRDLLAYNLSREGFAIETATNGKEALQKLEQTPASLESKNGQYSRPFSYGTGGRSRSDRFARIRGRRLCPKAGFASSACGASEI